MEMLWQKSIYCAHQLDQRTHGWLGLVTGALRQALLPDSVITAAAIGYFAIFSVFPLILLSIAIVGFSSGSLIDQHLIIQKLEYITPDLGLLFGKNIDSIVRARGPVTIVALVSLIWSTSSLFFMLTGCLNRIWGIKYNRPSWKQRGLAILIVLGFAAPILFLASFADNIIARLLTWIPAQIFQVVGGRESGSGCPVRCSLFYGPLPDAPACCFQLA